MYATRPSKCQLLHPASFQRRDAWSEKLCPRWSVYNCCWRIPYAQPNGRKRRTAGVLEFCQIIWGWAKNHKSLKSIRNIFNRRSVKCCISFQSCRQGRILECMKWAALPPSKEMLVALNDAMFGQQQLSLLRAVITTSRTWIWAKIRQNLAACEIVVLSRYFHCFCLASFLDLCLPLILIWI